MLLVLHNAGVSHNAGVLQNAEVLHNAGDLHNVVVRNHFWLEWGAGRFSFLQTVRGEGGRACV